MKPIRPHPKFYSVYYKGSSPADSDLEALTFTYSGDIPEVFSVWQPTFLERLKILFFGKIFLHVLGQTLPPVKLSVDFEHYQDIIRAYDRLDAQARALKEMLDK